jgi:hypothetical protein
MVREVILSGKFIFASYIVRIYRYEKDDPCGLVGVVEEAGGRGKKVFTNLEELWEIMNSYPLSPPSLRPRLSLSKSRRRRGRRR